MKRRTVLLLGIFLVTVVVAAALVRIRQADAFVPEREALWAIARVQAHIFGAVSTNVGCFSLRTGKSDVKVFVVDTSYSSFLTVHCDVEIRREGLGYRLTVTQSWEDKSTPQGGSPFSWVLGLFYHQPAHNWEYRIGSDGTVTVLPEQGPPPPQTYYH